MSKGTACQDHYSQIRQGLFQNNIIIFFIKSQKIRFLIHI